MKQRQRKLAIATSAAAGLVLLLASCGSGGMHDRVDAPESFESNGERIYFTASSESGEPIRARGGPSNAAAIHDLACADCHGEDGAGQRVTLMMETFTAPDITWQTLGAEEHGEDHEEDENGEEHPPYTAASLKAAITSGVNPAGEQPSERMPRWEMSPEDLDDLVAYLMTLGAEHSE